MEVFFEETFEKDLRKTSEKKLLETVKIIIKEVKQASLLGEVRNLKKMKKAETFYRIKTGNYRIGLEIY